MAKKARVAWVVAYALSALSVGCAAQSGSNSGSSGYAGAQAGAGGAATGGSATGGSATGGHATGGSATGGHATGGSATGGSSTGGHATGGSATGGSATGGSATGGTSTGGTGTGGTLPVDPCIKSNTCPPGQWINVTPSDLVMPDFGAGPIVADLDTPSDLYMGGGGDGLWKSTDYGNTWKKINSSIGYVPMGYVMAVLPGTPTKIVIAGYKVNHISSDGGTTFSDVSFNFPDSLYSIQVDPYDGTHLISGLHEVDGIVESTDSGNTWNYVGTGNFPSGGKSWYVFFVDTGSAATTRKNWFAIAQDGGSAVITSNGGTNWTIPTGVNGLQHVHGNSQIFQSGSTIWVPGIYGPGGGIYKSTDRGASFTRVYDGNYSVAWGTSKNVYAMWGWACSGCNLGASFSVAPLPAGTAFTKPSVPAGLIIGANHVVVTSDGTHNIFVGMMWKAGVWRYIEP